ncbi:MAG: YncE family protein [Bacteroidales bacterium]|nr:YncE family protein [Bacteroidales bacterium]
MKHEALLIVSCILALGAVGCEKGLKPSEGFTGEQVTVGETRDSYRNLFILSEGSVGKNEASLDFFIPAEGLYVRSAFSQVNPSISLGDTANDIIAVGDEIWIALNGSDIIEVIDTATLVHKAAITVPSPRYMATDGKFVYVTTYSGVFNATSGEWMFPDAENPKGAVGKIDVATKKVLASVEVGHQPEGLDLTADGKLLVANSGWAVGYENTISEITLSSFQVSATLTAGSNAKELFVTSDGSVWEHLLGDYYSVHTGLYKKTADGAERVTAEGCELCVGAIARDGEDFWIVGSDEEFDWSNNDKHWYVYKITNGVATKVNVNITAAYPFGIAVDPDNGDLFISDGGTGGNLGSVFCYSKADGYALKWKTVSGVFPGHFLFF